MATEIPTAEPDGELVRLRDGGSLYIDVQVYAGSHLPDAIREMAALANRLGICVWASLNGTRTLCRPGDDPALTYRAWENAQHRDPGYRYASA